MHKERTVLVTHSTTLHRRGIVRGARPSTSMTRLVRAFAGAAATCLTLGMRCAPEGEAPARADVAVEFELDRRGGLCPGPDGGGALCRLTVVVRDDGTWSAVGTPPPTRPGGAVRSGSASELAAIVDEGWEALTARAFTGTCPTAYDGSELTYTVRRIPRGPSAALADADIREVRSCTHDLTHPAAQAVLLRLGDLWRALALPE